MCVSSSEPIDPIKLMIGTVIDPSSAEVVRDALSLIRSLRLFGGSLNNAVFSIAITVRDELPFTDGLLLQQLYELQVEISFAKQISSCVAKTLNKFESFKLFDELRFDYFLWLDADIVVFADPVKHLRKHKYPGEIQCVPDLYSYTRRYPLLNTTSDYWNPNLPPFRLLGDNELAPYGTCNTGVLFFDSLSLKSFLIGLKMVQNDDFILKKYGHDRFIDSLFFIHAVHSQGIEVSIMPFSMNYMPFFEVELQQDTTTNEIIFGHFLSDTALYCISIPEPDYCRCIYENKNMQQNSLTVRTIDSLLPMEICLVMAGANLPPHTRSVFDNNNKAKMDGYFDLLCDRSEDEFGCVHSKYFQRVSHAMNSTTSQLTEMSFAADGTATQSDENSEFNDGNTVSDNSIFTTPTDIQAAFENQLASCRLIWPPEAHHLQTISTVTSTINLQTNIIVNFQQSIIAALIEHPQLLLRVRYIVSYATCDELRENSQAFSPQLHKRLIDYYCGVVRHAQNTGNSIGGTVIHDFTTLIPVTNALNREELTMEVSALLQFQLNNSSNNSIDTTKFPNILPMKLEAILCLVEHNNHDNISNNIVQMSSAVYHKSYFTVSVASLQPTGQVVYSNYPLYGSLPLILESQLQLVEFFHTRRINSGIGVIHCCDTIKGVLTVRKLIFEWQGDTLILMLSAAPLSLGDSDNNNSETTRLIQLVGDLVTACSDRGTSANSEHQWAKCVIISPVTVKTNETIITATNLSPVQIASMLSNSGTAEQLVSFVYMDVSGAGFRNQEEPIIKTTAVTAAEAAESYLHYLELLTVWYEILRKGSIMVGSRLGRRINPPHNYRGNNSNGNCNNSLTDNQLIRKAVDYHSLKSQTNYLATYMEQDSEYCLESKYVENVQLECSPAWYFLKT